MSPGHKRQIAEEFVSGGRCTGRAACRHFGLHRSTFACQAKQPNAWLSKLKSAVRRVSNQYPETGYPKIARLLKRDGWYAGARMVQRLRRELGLAVPAKKPNEGAGDPLRAFRPRRGIAITSGPGTSFTTLRCAEASFACST